MLFSFSTPFYDKLTTIDQVFFLFVIVCMKKKKKKKYLFLTRYKFSINISFLLIFLPRVSSLHSFAPLSSLLSTKERLVDVDGLS